MAVAQRIRNHKATAMMHEEPGQEDSDPKNVSPVPIVMALAKRKKRYRKMANAKRTCISKVGTKNRL